ncbi:hypothetical protein [Nocardioides campestrisoli]|uniref:hypothetical protein n=1 Tax=Nocardioides campestrisoli TaxID=2736757 RepID=UPI0015E7153A|nr:hypothetical protein [Nocardioides campestrisoli]
MKVLVRPAMLALMVALSVSACGSDEEPTDGSTVGAELATRGQEKGSDTGKGGEKAPETYDMPADFPAEVPLVKGKIRFSSAEPGSWVVTLDVAGDHDKISERAVDQVLAAGFEERDRAATADVLTVVTGSPEYDLTVSSQRNAGSDDSTVSYVVTEVAGS